MNTMTAKAGCGMRLDLDAGPPQDMISSFELHLLAKGKTPKTVRTYTEAALWIFGAAQQRDHPLLDVPGGQLCPIGFARGDQQRAQDRTQLVAN